MANPALARRVAARDLGNPRLESSGEDCNAGTLRSFLALVIGLLQELERRLTATPRAPTFVLASDRALLSTRYFAGAAWSTGFISALQFNATGLGSRSVLSRVALENIVEIASLRTKEPSAMSRVAAELRANMSTLNG